LKGRNDDVIHVFSSSGCFEQLGERVGQGKIPPELGTVLGYLLIPGDKEPIQLPAADSNLRKMVNEYLGDRIILDGIHHQISVTDDGRFTLNKLA